MGRTVEPVAVFRSPFDGKFGLPRQGGLAPSLRGRVEFLGPFGAAEALRGLEAFDYVWLLWGFDRAERGEGAAASFHATVRPPRFGGNERVGVFATRSPFRPNGLGLSAVRLAAVREGALDVLGADLADGTPVYDVKPYLPYADAHPDACAGWAAAAPAPALAVRLPPALEAALGPADAAALRETLALDPRPPTAREEGRVHGFSFAGREIRFRVSGGALDVL